MGDIKKIRFDGKKRSLKWTADAYYKVKEKIGREWKSKAKELNIKTLSAILWGGLLHEEDPDISLDRIKKALETMDSKELRKLQKQLEISLYHFIQTVEQDTKKVKKLENTFNKMGEELSFLKRKH